MTERETIKVVCAIVRDEDGKILLGRRKPGLVRAGQWELPGGKIKNGESAEAAIARELLEEMDVETKTASFIGSQVHHYSDLSIDLIGMSCTLEHTPLSSTDHDALNWVQPEDLTKYDLSKADFGLIQRCVLGDGKMA